MAHWGVHWTQLVLSALFLSSLALLVGGSFAAAAADRRAAEQVTSADSAAAIAVFTQRESLVLRTRFEQWVAGQIPRREVQLQRALLARRLSTLSSDESSATRIAGTQYQQSLAALDEELSDSSPGLLDPAAAEQLRITLDPALAEFERDASRLAQVYQSLVDDSNAYRALTHSRDQQANALLLAVTGVSGLALGLVSAVRIRTVYRRARNTIESDRRALDRATVLDRAESDILAGIVEGRPTQQLVDQVLDLAEHLTTSRPHFSPTDPARSAGLAAGHDHLDPTIRVWPVAMAGGELLGTLVATDDGTTPGADASLDRCAHLLALVVDHALVTYRLEYRATHDALTGLPNRSMIIDALTEKLTEPTPVALVFFDLDRFKLVNDSLGHRAGDVLLCEVAARLVDVCSPRDALTARLGGDEFVALLTSTNALVDAIAIATDVCDALDEPFTIDGAEAFISVSAGISVSAAPTTNPSSMLRDADVAMYSAKNDPDVRIKVYDEHLEYALKVQRDADMALRRALAERNVRVDLQPIVELIGRKVTGFEALARLTSSNGVELAPTDFLPVARHNGLMNELGRQVVLAALAAVTPHRDHFEDLSLWINVASSQLRDPNFPTWLVTTLGHHDLAPEQLVVEISEAESLELTEVVEQLDALRAVGIKVAIDDFGTGYSTIVRLAEMPIDIVKLDRSLLAAIDTDLDGYRLLAATVRLVQAIDRQLVVEGVQTDMELDAIKAMGCTLAQGYLLGPPAPPEQLVDHLTSGR